MNNLSTLKYSWFLSILQTKLSVVVCLHVYEHLRNTHVNIFEGIRYTVAMLTDILLPHFGLATAHCLYIWIVFAKAPPIPLSFF